MDLIPIEPHGAKVAHMVGTAQRDAFARAGHMLTIYDGRTWRSLRVGCKNGKGGRVPISCGRCGAIAPLAEWYMLCTHGKRAYADMRRRQPQEQQDRLYKMAHRCQGDAIAADLHEWIIAEIEARWRGRPAPAGEDSDDDTNDGDREDATGG